MNLSFSRPSRKQLAAFDFLMRAEQPFTRQEFIEGCNQSSETIGAGLANSYLRGFCQVGILEEKARYPFNTWELAPGWAQTEASARLKEAYYS